LITHGAINLGHGTGIAESAVRKKVGYQMSVVVACVAAETPRPKKSSGALPSSFPK